MPGWHTSSCCLKDCERGAADEDLRCDELSGAGRSDADAAARPDLKICVCGEHGGDPDSVHFFHASALDHVSCSPFRVPVARLEAGRAALPQTEAGESR